MAWHRSHSVAFKRQVVEASLSGETLRGLALRHDLSRNLIRIWVAKHEAGASTRTYRRPSSCRSTRRASPHWSAGSDGRRWRSSFQNGAYARTTAEMRDDFRRCRPAGLSVSRGCALKDLPRSTFYDEPTPSTDAAERLALLTALCDEFECYGYRRLGAALRQHGIVVNSKKLRRLMRENGWQPRLRRRFKTTTDSGHDLPVFLNRPLSCRTALTSSGPPI